MKISKLLLLVLLAIIVVCFVGCEKNTVDFTYIVNPDGDSITITRLTNEESKSLKSITIPQEMDGYLVTRIGNIAFRNCEFSSVELPSSITSIGVAAFEGCTNLTDINIPEGLTTIGEAAFRGCVSLVSIKIPESVTEIGAAAFKDCTKLATIKIPSTVTYIKASTFENCSNLWYVDIPETILGVGRDAFKNCEKMLQISQYRNCEYLKIGDNQYHVLLGSVHKGLNIYTVHEETKIIADGSFENCYVANEIRIPNGVVGIGNRAFYGCHQLSSITIPEGVTSIGDYTFYDCRKLESITIPNSVKSIGTYAFKNCSKISSIIVPNSVTSIGNSAFGGCTSITRLTVPYVPEGNAEQNGLSIWFDGDSSMLSYSLETIVVTGGETLGQYAFAQLTNLKDVVLPSSLTCIDYGAFMNCSSIQSIEIPDGVRYIDEYAFFKCTNLASVIIPASVTEIKAYAFFGCNISTIYYTTFRTNWNNITIAIGNNSYLDKAYFYYNYQK